MNNWTYRIIGTFYKEIDCFWFTPSYTETIWVFTNLMEMGI